MFGILYYIRSGYVESSNYKCQNLDNGNALHFFDSVIHFVKNVQPVVLLASLKYVYVYFWVHSAADLAPWNDKSSGMVLHVVEPQFLHIIYNTHRISHTVTLIQWHQIWSVCMIYFIKYHYSVVCFTTSK